MIFNNLVTTFLKGTLLLSLIFLSACSKDKVWIPSWKQSSDMTVARAGAAYVAYEDYIYAIAGVDGKNFLKSIERAKVNADGSLSSWQVISELPEPRGFISATVEDGRLYVVGGGNGPYGKNLLNSVVSATLSKTGEIGVWRTELNTMLIPRRCAKIFVAKEGLYAVGGFGGTLLDTVEFSPFLDDGQLGKWQLNKETLKTPRYVNELKKIENKVFAIGGHHATSGRGISSVEYLRINEPNAAWQETENLTNGRYAFASASIGNNMYVMGGLSGAEYLDSIEYVNADELTKGEAWQPGIKLPEKMANFSALTIGSRLYLFGGSTRHQYLNQVWYADTNSQGKLGYWGKKEDLVKIENNKKSINVSNLPNSGLVLERLETPDYVYMKVRGYDLKEIWLAAPKNKIPTKSKVRYSEGVYMSNFFSKSLKKEFDAVLFVGTIEQEE